MAYTGREASAGGHIDSCDILRDKNTGVLKAAKAIDELYEKCEEARFSEYSKPVREFNEMLAALPQEAWIQ